MKYGTLVRIASPAEAADKFNALRNAGMDACQLVYKPEKYDISEAAVIRKAADDAGIEISAQFCGFRDANCVWDTKFDFVNCGINSPIYGAARIEYLLSAIPFIKALGITDMIIHPGFIPNNPFTDSYTRMLAAVHLLGTKLKAEGLNLLFETGTESPISLLRLIQDTGLDNLYINLDTANPIMYGYGNPVDALYTFGKYVRNLHFKDGLPPTIPGKLGPEVAIGKGHVDFPKVVSMLKDLGYDRFCIIEREIGGDEQKRDILNAFNYIKELFMTGGATNYEQDVIDNSAPCTSTEHSRVLRQ